MMAVLIVGACAGSTPGDAEVLTPPPTESLASPAASSSDGAHSPEDAICALIEAADPIADSVRALLEALIADDRSAVERATADLIDATNAWQETYASVAADMDPGDQTHFAVEAREVDYYSRLIAEWVADGATPGDEAAREALSDFNRLREDTRGALPFEATCPSGGT